MTAHGIDDMASRFPESLSEAQISEINKKAIPINKKKATKFGFSVFQYKILLLKGYSSGQSHFSEINTKLAEENEFVTHFVKKCLETRENEQNVVLNELWKHSETAQKSFGFWYLP